ncbi:unnamed protein product, partial [Durusdinium trenchii]
HRSSASDCGGKSCSSPRCQGDSGAKRRSWRLPPLKTKLKWPSACRTSRWRRCNRSASADFVF